MRKSNEVLLASNNLDKLAEFQELFKKFPGITILPAREIVFNSDKIGLVETHGNYVDNAIAKARLINQASHYPSLADDSGLEVVGLNNEPGPRSARYAVAKAGI